MLFEEKNVLIYNSLSQNAGVNVSHEQHGESSFPGGMSRSHCYSGGQTPQVDNRAFCSYLTCLDPPEVQEFEVNIVGGLFQLQSVTLSET